MKIAIDNLLCSLIADSRKQLKSWKRESVNYQKLYNRRHYFGVDSSCQMRAWETERTWWHFDLK